MNVDVFGRPRRRRMYPSQSLKITFIKSPSQYSQSYKNPANNQRHQRGQAKLSTNSTLATMLTTRNVNYCALSPAANI
jgi:hypothetical protein